jgi:hypothetical protein
MGGEIPLTEQLDLTRESRELDDFLPPALRAPNLDRQASFFNIVVG